MKNMKLGTKIALGAVVVAGLGGGLALAVGDERSEGATKPPTTCAGTWVGGYCWYFGAEGESCTEVCASHDGYHKATRTYAGSDGTDSNCYTVLSALGAPPDDDGAVDWELHDLGCIYKKIGERTKSIYRFQTGCLQCILPGIRWK